MPFQVTHTDQRDPQGIGCGLGITEADEQRACQTGPLRDGDSSQIPPSEACLL